MARALASAAWLRANNDAGIRPAAALTPESLAGSDDDGESLDVVEAADFVNSSTDLGSMPGFQYWYKS